jgi:hypothetical protein
MLHATQESSEKPELLNLPAEQAAHAPTEGLPSKPALHLHRLTVLLPVMVLVLELPGQASQPPAALTVLDSLNVSAKHC